MLLFFCRRDAAPDPAVVKRAARRVIELAPQIQDKKAATREEKALARRCAKHLDAAA